MNEPQISRTIAPEPGLAETLEDALGVLADGCLGFVAAYLAAQRGDENEWPNVYLWAGVTQAASNHVHALTYRERPDA